MFERGISAEEVRKVVETGETIDSYPDDSPYPSRLLLGWTGARPLHVLVADTVAAGEAVAITAYEPDSALRNDAYRQRRNP